MRNEILTILAQGYEHSAYSDTIRKQLIKDGVIPDGSWFHCKSIDVLSDLKREGLVSEYSEWGVSSYTLTPAGRKLIGVRK